MGKRRRAQISKKKTNNSKNALMTIGALTVFVALLIVMVYNPMSQSRIVEAPQSNVTKSDMRYPSAQDFTLTDINGKRFTLGDFKGKIVILDFMGATCTPCRQQVVELVKVHSVYSDKVEILSISVQGGKGMDQLLQSFAESYNVKWRIAIDVEGAQFKYRITMIPTIIMIDGDGYVRFRHEGVAEAITVVHEIRTILGEV
jgi:cytochrome oxidase Cu insertion factor (SCO1/SenC/PrrC family)